MDDPEPLVLGLLEDGLDGLGKLLEVVLEVLILFLVVLNIREETSTLLLHLVETLV